MRWRPSFLIVIASLALVDCQSTSSALKAMQDRKWEKAEATLRKQLTDEKDSLFSDVYYAYSLMYSDTAFQDYQIDSAYQYILLASRDFQQTPAEEKEKLDRQLQLTDRTLLLQKRRLDSLAFEQATDSSTVAYYQQFIDEHTDAPQQQEAVQLRNQLAYDAARSLDNFQAYREFMDTYPEADQVPQAEERYNTLVFQAQTETGDLGSYYQFLEAFPQSPYRRQAEQAIYRLSTADNQPTDYLRFARDFPDSPLSRQAVGWLYQQFKEVHPVDSFFIEYSDLPFADSLQESSELEPLYLIPWMEDGQFGFINAEGQTVIDPQFTAVQPSYLCEGVRSDLVFVARDSDLLALNKRGEVVYTANRPDNDWPAIEALGGGLTWIGFEGAGEVRHTSGETVIARDENVAEVSLLPFPSSTGQPYPRYQFIKYRVGPYWGIKSFTGSTLLPPEYDAIEEYNHFIVLEKDGQLAVTNRSEISSQITAQTFAPDFQYEDVTLLGNDHLIAYSDDYEAVLDTTLQTVIPLGHHTVLRQVSRDEDRPLWLLKSTEEQQAVRNDSLITQAITRYSLYPAYSDLETPPFSQVFYNDRWLALKADQKFFLLDDQTSTFPTTPYDSVNIISEQFAVIFHGANQSIDSVALLIAQENPIAFKFTRGPVPAADLQFRLIRTQPTDGSAQPEESLLVRQPGRPELLLSQSGDTVLEASLQNVLAYPNGLFVIERGGKQGVVDAVGNELVPAQYERIGNYQSPGLLSIFHRQKFGLFDAQTSTLIKPTYEASLQEYAIVVQDSLPIPLYVAQKGGQYGVIDAQQQPYLPFAFQAVRYWNDTAALVQYDDQWMIYSLQPDARRKFDVEEALYSDISEFSPLPVKADSPEKLIKIYKDQGYGVLSSKGGEILSPTFDDIRFIQDPETEAPLYLTEKYVSEAELYILIYMDAQGNIVRREAHSSDEYDRLYCDE